MDSYKIRESNKDVDEEKKETVSINLIPILCFHHLLQRTQKRRKNKAEAGAGTMVDTNTMKGRKRFFMVFPVHQCFSCLSCRVCEGDVTSSVIESRIPVGSPKRACACSENRD